MFNRAAGAPLVASSCLGLTLGTLYVNSLGILIAPIQAEFGWSRAAITSGLTIVSVVTVVASPLIGSFIDRLGSGTPSDTGQNTESRPKTMQCWSTDRRRSEPLQYCLFAIYIR